MQSLDCKVVFVSLCILHLLTLSEGRPARKRSVTEVQLMHNVGEHKQAKERRDWLQMRLQGIHTAPGRSRSQAGGPRRRPVPQELSDLSDLTTEEIQDALKPPEKLLNSKHS